MSFTDNYLAILNEEQTAKKKKKKQNTGHSFTDTYAELIAEETAPKKETATKKETQPLYVNKTAPLYQSNPVSEKKVASVITAGQLTQKSKKEEDDGSFLDLIGKSAMSGLASFNKGITSTVDVILGKPLQALGWENNPISAVAEHYSKGYDRFSQEAEEEEKKLGGSVGANIVRGLTEGTVAAVPDAILALMTAGGSKVATTSTLATKAAYEGGNLLTKAGVTVETMMRKPQFWTSFARTYGTDYEEAKAKGADDMTAALGSMVTSLVNAGVEIGTDGMSGFQGLPEKVAKGGKSAIFDWVQSSLEEGSEEVVQGVVSNLVSKAVYDRDTEVLNAEQMLKEFGMGAAVGGILGGGQIAAMGAANAVTDAAQQREAKKLTENEQKVVEKEYENRLAEAEKDGKLTRKQQNELYDAVLRDMERGYISTDTIEKVLGGETYKGYKNTVDYEDGLQSEFDQLNRMKQGEMTGEQVDRRNELKAQLEELKTKSQRKQMQTNLRNEVMGLVKGDRLAESYNEQYRRGEAFTADLTKYDEKQRATVQKAIDSGVLNNTNRSHELVDLVANISADKDIVFDFANNEKIKESGYAIEGKVANGFITKDGITLNVQSAKALNRVVGHEITHVLEGTELYDTLKVVVADYAKTKGDYHGRYAQLSKLYEGQDADIEAELTADLIGDYLFTDSDFVHNLSVNHRNVFQKIYDEIKYICKVVTAGSKEARQLEKVKYSFDQAYKASGKQTEGTTYSLSDSDGKQLTQEQAEYFKDSKIKDSDGNLLKVYHGSPNKFTTFRQGTADGWGTGVYFTDNRAEAENYGENVVEAYLNITNPFNADTMSYYDIGAENTEAYREYDRKLWQSRYDEYDTYEEYKADGMGADMQNIYEEDVEVFNKILRELGYDGIIADGSNGIEGLEIVAFKENQAKLTTNQQPTGDPDIRFSLSESVEETKDLVALHNLTEDKLKKSLQLGGLPMPSIAIAKAKDGHSEFGEISLVLHKETIDPESSRKNKLYSGDAWTPTYPKVEYKPNEKVLKAVKSKIYALVPYDVQDVLGSLMFDTDNARSDLNRYNGNMVEAYEKNDAMKYAYLKDTGSDISLPMKEADLYRYGDASNDAVRYFSGKLVNGLQTVEHYRNMSARDLLQDKSLTEAVADAQNFDVLRVMEPGSDEYLEYERNPVFHADEVPFRDIDNFLSAAKKLFTNGVQQTVDRQAAKKLIRDNVDQTAYESWLNELFSGVVEKEGIRNNKDVFTPSGNRRSFEALHYEHNLENVIKAMRDTGEKGIAFGGGSIFGAATTEFSSVDEMKQARDRLQKMSDEEYQAMRDEFSDRFFEIAKSLPDNKNNFMATDDAANTLVEAVSKYKTRTGIANYLKRELKGWATYSDHAVDDLIELVRDIRNMPTGYFEAKPQRAVGFDEVGVFVIPNNADIKLKQELLNRGYSIAEYDPNVEGDRQRVVNGFEEYKFSLSNVGETIQQRSSSDIFGRDVMLQKPDAEPAPVSNTESNTFNTDSNADISKTEIFEMFPDDLAPVHTRVDEIDAEMEAMQAEVNVLAQQMALGAITPEEFVAKSAEYDPRWAALNREREALTAEDTERVDSLAYADAPEEVEAPYYGEEEPITVDDPFRDRDEKEVSSQKVKAYMYENPDVKPFFQMEADRMLGELANTTKGERWYNDEVYYRSNGEAGWGGTKRNTSESIEELLDSWGMSYADIEKGLNAIIKDHGAENIAAAKKIEFVLHDRLMKGYNDFYSNGRIEPNQDYINLLYEQQITAYNEEARQSLRDADAPPDLAPVVQPAPNRTAAEPAPLFESASGQQTMWEEPETEEARRSRRKELHAGIVEDIKNVFRDRGFNFDRVLKNAKNLSTFATVDNTPQRVLEKALGYKAGQILADETVNKVAQNETEGIKWLNSFTDRKNGVLAQLSKQYHIKPGSKESAAAQMYAEGFYVAENGDIIEYGDAELMLDFPDIRVRHNIKDLARDPRIRLIYDQTLDAINESRTRNAYPAIERLDNYFLHFRAMDDTFSRLGLPFNPNDIRAKDLPTDLNGVTADLKPGQPYFASAMHRTGKRTTFDLLGGLERYLTSAKNQIYHIDDIQTLRALRNYIADTYGQANGLDGLDMLSEEEAQERIEQVYGSHLSTFAKFLNEEANVLAGKTALIDRGLEGIIGRRGITFLNNLNQQVGSNMVGYNLSSSLTNFLPVAQTFAKTNKFDFVKAFAQTVANKTGAIFGRTDGFAENSPVMIRRAGAERFHRTAWQKIGDPGYALMGAVDSISTELIARTKYNELTRKGMDAQRAHYETDKWVSRLMGDRSLGQMPQIYNSKMLGLVTKFQLEVRNQLDSQFYDTIQETKASNEEIQNALARNAKTAAKVASTFVQLAVVQHLFGKAFESVAGYNPAFDIIEVLLTACGYDDDEDSEDTVLDNVEQGFLALLEDLPYASTFMDGGRIPMSAALPVEELVKGKDEWGNDKSRWKTLGEIAPYYLMPGGYGQAKKTAQGLSMFSEEHPIAGSYTDSGNLRFPIEDTLKNRVQAGVFGQWANENARDYFDNNRNPLKEKQIQEFIDVEMPIQEYWDYREGLNKQETLEDKFEYISDLDLSVEQKNILINNIVDRKKDVDMSNYEDFSSYEEFDFYSKNTEKYNFLQDNGVSYKEYKSSEDAKEEYDATYSWYKNNPEKVTLSKAITDNVIEYRKYTGDLYDIRADKDENGDSISGTAKAKKIDYINNLDLDYGQRLILFRTLYDGAKDRAEYDGQIVEYLNGRDDLTYEERLTILRELDFEVSEDGSTVYW